MRQTAVIGNQIQALKEKIMNTHADKTQENKSQSVANASPQKSGSESTFQFVDNRPEAIARRKLQEMANNSPQAKQAAQLQAIANNHSFQQQQPVQKKTNNTGLPDNLKSGIENLSGYSMDDVKVHYNSDKPAQLQAHAYAQGTDIHLGSGQEKHLPHEAWHVVQQKQGRVEPTMQMKGGIQVNDNKHLESEATHMGELALQKAPTNDVEAHQQTGTPAAQLKIISLYASGIIQRAMDQEESKKLYDVLQQYADQIDEQTLQQIFNKIQARYDTLAEATNDLNARIDFARRQAQMRDFRVNATTYPRVFLAGNDKPTREQLIKNMGQKPKTAKGFDLSYRQHTDVIDQELDQFLPQGNFDRGEQRERYYEASRQSQTKTVPRNKKGMFTHKAQGGLPMTSITPEMMEHYHAMHYARQLVRPDETQSTRTYEAQYTKRAYESMNVETFRAFFLPPGSEADSDQELMVNTIGASLDSNAPTRGNTIGSGIVNKAVYKHFQKTLELLNADLDQSLMKGNLESFETRTQFHIQFLRQYSLKGMRANEQEHANSQGDVPSDTLQPIIQQTGLMITGMLNTLAHNQQLPEFNIELHDKLVMEKLRIIAVMLGVMIKTEKRLLIDHVILNQGNEQTGQTILSQIGNLAAIEQNINQALNKYAEPLKALGRGKSLDQGEEFGLSMTAKDNIEKEDELFDQIVLANNCLPEAILGRKLTQVEARILRLNLIDNGQQIGGFLDADQPVIETIIRQFNLNMNIIIYEGDQIWRRFIVNGGNVLDITLSNIPIPQNTAIVLERINGNHFIRKI